MYRRALIGLAVLATAATAWWPAPGRAYVPAEPANLEATGGASEEVPIDRPFEAREAVDEGTEWSASDGLRWPIEGAINTPFGGGHDGIDIEAETGDPILAAAPGRVVFAGDDGDGYGLRVVIAHGDRISTLYSHLDRIEVRAGTVEAGQRLGTAGCTGSCSGDHLHFEVRENGRAVEPLSHLP